MNDKKGKYLLKERAIQLRREGKTCSEILKEVPVAKSTISLWLKEVGLSVPQRQRITEKRMAAQKRGAEARKRDRIKRQTQIMEISRKEIKSISSRELWLIGIALYWAEGSKEKEYSPGTKASFSNSDPKMIAIFLKWLKECVRLQDEDISADLYIHDSHKGNVEKVLDYWQEILNVPRSFFKFTYFKRNKINTKRKNIGALYYGLLRVNMRASSQLNRRIAGWIQGINEHCGIV